MGYPRDIRHLLWLAFSQVASVGMTEEEGKAAGIEYRKGTFPFMANSRARTVGDAEGLAKFIACK